VPRHNAISRGVTLDGSRLPSIVVLAVAVGVDDIDTDTRIYRWYRIGHATHYP
jgi:hypothetical protein